MDRFHRLPIRMFGIALALGLLHDPSNVAQAKPRPTEPRGSDSRETPPVPSEVKEKPPRPAPKRTVKKPEGARRLRDNLGFVDKDGNIYTSLFCRGPFQEFHERSSFIAMPTPKVLDERGRQLEAGQCGTRLLETSRRLKAAGSVSVVFSEESQLTMALCALNDECTVRLNAVLPPWAPDEQGQLHFRFESPAGATIWKSGT